MGDREVCICRANGMEIAYEWHGEPGQPVLLMIQGLGMPLTAWPPQMIEQLTARGYRVLIFDNRDIGRSGTLNTAGVPSLPATWIKAMLRLPVAAPYDLSDMMRDVHGLLDALDIEAAHVLGISMGGMIAQLLAMHHPQRVTSLTSLMSTTGNRRLPGPSWAVARHMMSRPRSGSLEDRLVYGVRTWQLIGSPGYPTPEPAIRERLERIFARGAPFAGIARQMSAIMASPSRVEGLRRLTVPTLVIHGDRDPLVPLAGGRDTAKTVPGARLEVVPGMGHDLPTALLPTLVQMISSHAA